MNGEKQMSQNNCPRVVKVSGYGIGWLTDLSRSGEPDLILSSVLTMDSDHFLECTYVKK